ncbi:MAG: DALR domain-containing protein, partial [Cyanobacteria bacterium J06621_3]
GWTGQDATLDEVAVAQFQGSMDDDFNTPGAIAVLFGLAKELQRQGNLIVHAGNPDAEPVELHQQWQTLVKLAGVLGLEAQTTDSASTDSISDNEIESLIAQRKAAKQAKNYTESDRIRDELSEQGITLIDKPGGVVTWHR